MLIFLHICETRQDRSVLVVFLISAVLRQGGMVGLLCEVKVYHRIPGGSVAGEVGEVRQLPACWLLGQCFIFQLLQQFAVSLFTGRGIHC